MKPTEMLLVASLLLSEAAHSRQAWPEAEAVDRAVLAEMEEQKLVGLAIGIIRDSKVVYAKGYGFADLEKRVPVTTQTVFNWASNSKPLMAVAAMQLVGEGKLDLDQSIANYLPDLPEHLRPITTRQLLCHQSGIPHYQNGRIAPMGKTFPVEQQSDPAKSMQRFLMSPLIFEPGTDAQYSSYAYILLSAVVQAAGKKPLAQQLGERIVKPLGLESFQWDSPDKGQANWAQGYRATNEGFEKQEDVAHFWKHGAGGYKSNVVDFAKFAEAAINSTLIDQALSDQMWTAQKTAAGKPTSHGLGWYVSGSGRGLKLSHNGRQSEARTRIVLYPMQRHGIVVMCNTKHCDPGQLSTAVYAAISQIKQALE